MKRRLSLAVSLIGNSRIVFFDEPTTGALLLLVLSRACCVLFHALCLVGSSRLRDTNALAMGNCRIGPCISAPCVANP